MRIHKVSITQIILVRFDQIPLNKLIHSSYLESLAKRFKFNSAEAVGDSAGNTMIVCRHGIHVSDGEEYMITELAIQERKILFKIDNGSSMEADEFFADLKDFLGSLLDRTDELFLQPVVKSEESEIIAQLDFSIESLFSPGFIRFVNSDIVGAATSELAEASVRPGSIKFHLDYIVPDSHLSDYRITLSPKEFMIEPRMGYPLTDQIYYSKAPIDTDTHWKLLERLEATVSDKE